MNDFIENGLVLLPFIVGTTFLMVGLLIKKKPPKQINPIYGYRTKRSMKDQKSWDFAQRHSAKEMSNAGLYLLVFSILGYFIKVPQNISYPVGIGIMLILMVNMFIRTEKALKASQSETP